MPKKRAPQLEDQISSALNSCIRKIASRLESTFDPEDKDSLALFKQFCSALNARRQWFKSISKEDDKSLESANKINQTIEKQIDKAASEPTFINRLFNKSKTNGSFQEKAKNNALVCKPEPDANTKRG